MRLSPIILKLRLSNTYFANRVGGAAELTKGTQWTLKNDMAFVIPLAESAEENTMDSSIDQNLVERFGVVVALSCDTEPKDLTGLVDYDRLHDIRAEFFHALVGLDLGYNGLVTYRGGRLLNIDTARMWYQFEFEYPSILKADEDGFGELQCQPVDERQKVEDLPDFLRVFNQYIITPSMKWEDVLLILQTEGTHLPDQILAPDMEQMIDFSQPYTGGFNYGFDSGFDFYRENR